MNQDSHPSNRDPDLESRIVALVLGEAPEAERKELEALIAQRPELTEFRREIQQLDGLLRDVVDGDSMEQSDHEWKLPPKKRDFLLSSIDDDAPPSAPVTLAMTTSDQRGFPAKSMLNVIAKVAAVVCVAVFLGNRWLTTQMAMLPRVGALHRFDVSEGEEAEAFETETFEDSDFSADYAFGVPGPEGNSNWFDGTASVPRSDEESKVASFQASESDVKGSLAELNERLSSLEAPPSPY
ncbi:MAG: hypothetical protein AAF989_10615, partial [Planctomycetota bacterium]